MVIIKYMYVVLLLLLHLDRTKLLEQKKYAVSKKPLALSLAAYTLVVGDGFFMPYHNIKFNVVTISHYFFDF